MSRPPYMTALSYIEVDLAVDLPAVLAEVEIVKLELRLAAEARMDEIDQA